MMEPFILPEEKLNELAQKVSEDLLEQYYFEQDHIQGEALKSFAGHEQVNRFLIFQVFQVWEMQINKLYHPYFNLEKEEIKQTLQTLKNQISRCIEVSKDDFQPMLKRAVYNNLRLLLSPRETFENFFFAQQETISLATYERYAQFFHDLDFVVDIILKYYQKNEKEEIDKGSYFEKMEKVVEAYNRKSGQDFDQYRKTQFHVLTGRNLDQVMQEAQAEIQAREAQQRAQEEEARRQAEEEARRKEAEARQQAEAEARRREEEARRQEEEARRQAQEEAMRRAEEEKKRKSFFDTLSEEKKSSFDLDLDELDAPASQPLTPPIPDTTPEEISKPAAETTPEPEPEPEPEAEVGETPEATHEVKVEVTPEPEPETTPEPEIQPEAKPVIEPKAEAETEPEPEAKPTPEPPTVESHPVAESASHEQPEKFTQEDPMESTPEPEHKPEPTAEQSSSQPTKRESTSDFLDRFLSERQRRDAGSESTTSAEETDKSQEDTEQKEKPTSVLDRLNERSRTVADRFTKPKSQVADSLNGKSKIKLDEIPIHKQYQYVQKVFEGNNVRFRIIVDKVNNAQNKDEVEDILTKFVLSNENLDRKDHVVNEFIELLRNRF